MASSYLCHLYLRFSLPANLLAALTPKCVASTNAPGNTEPEVGARKGLSVRAETVSQICTAENGNSRSASAWLDTEEPAPLNRKQLFTCTSRTKVTCLRTAAVDGLNHTTFSWDTGHERLTQDWTFIKWFPHASASWGPFRTDTHETNNVVHLALCSRVSTCAEPER